MDVHGIVNHYMQTDVYQQSLAFHRKYRGKLSVVPVIPIVSKDDLAVMYTPGVAEPCRVIAKDPQASFDLTMRGRSVAVVSNGTAVLGLGDIGPEAAMPVMEGKALLLKQFGGVDAIPLVIDARDPQEIIAFVKQIRPTFAGINLEDIAAPACFAVEDGLQDLGIPVIIALTMMDELPAKGISLDPTLLSTFLQAPVVPMVAVKEEGVGALKLLLQNGFSYEYKRPWRLAPAI